MRRKSLIVKLGAIGDIAMVLPAARQLYESGSEIDWLCGKSVAPLLDCYDWLRPIVVDDAKLLRGGRVKAALEMIRVWKRLTGSTYEQCAVLAYDPRYQLLTLPVRAKKKIALGKADRRFQLVSERQHTAEYARILCGWKDECRWENLVPIVPDRLPTNPLGKSDRVRIALVPGGARNLVRDNPLRRWPLESYVALAKMLVKKGYEVVLVGGPEDGWVRSAFAEVLVIDCIGRWTLPELLAFFSSCDCVVTHDTGPMHLAGLVDCGIVAIFGPTAPSKFLPRRKGVVGLWGGERMPCRPCYDGRDYAPCRSNDCMKQISATRTAEAVEVVLADPHLEWEIVTL